MTGVQRAVAIEATIIVLLILVWYLRNRLVQKRNVVQEAQAQLDVQLDRRHHVVPALVAAVSAAQAQERAVLERVATAAEQAQAAAPPPEPPPVRPGRPPSPAVRRARLEQLAGIRRLGLLEGELTSALRDLQRVVEASPQLQTDQNALRLHEDLLSAENRVAFARQHYNDSAMLYNNAVQAFPSNLVARFTGIRPADYLDLKLLADTP